MKHDPIIARSIISLASTGAPWDTFVEALRAMEKACMTDLVAASEDTIFVAQGRVRAVMDILSAIEKARSVADRHK